MITFALERSALGNVSPRGGGDPNLGEANPLSNNAEALNEKIAALI